MARKDDLEQHILDSYQLIKDYERIVLVSPRPEEKMEARIKAEERWGLIHSYLGEYIRICHHLGTDLHEEIFQLAVSIEEIADKIRTLGIGPGNRIQFVKPAEIKILRDKIEKLEKTLEQPAGRGLVETNGKEIAVESAQENSGIRLFVLHNGSQVRCQPKPFRRGISSELFLTIDGGHIIKLLRQPEPWREQALKLLLDRFNPGQFDLQCHQLLCWPNGIIKSPQLGIRMPYASSNMRSLGWFVVPKARSVLPPEVQGDWRGHVEIAIKIAQAVRCLHMSGLCHSDLSPNNVLVDPRDGSMVLIDLDQVAVPGIIPPAILGTPRYMAPEIVMCQTHGNVWADLHSLAVLIYQTLLFQHPLLGPKVYSNDPVEDEQLAFGQQALYIEHPTDFSNRPGTLISCAILGTEVAQLFQRAFVDGIHTPSKRPTAAEWETALSRMHKKIIICSNPECEHKHFVLTDLIQGKCIWCGAETTTELPSGVQPSIPIFIPRIAKNYTGFIDQISEKSRRLPLYLLLDTSDANKEASVEEINRGINLLYDMLMSDPMTIETVHLSVITFGGQAKKVIPLTSLAEFDVSPITAQGERLMGSALGLLYDLLDNDIIPDTVERKGDYKPLVILMTGGMPADLDIWQYQSRAIKANQTDKIADIIALMMKSEKDELNNTLKLLTDTVLDINAITPDEFSQYFRWISQQLMPLHPPPGIVTFDKTRNLDKTKNLPPSPPGIQVIL